MQLVPTEAWHSEKWRLYPNVKNDSIEITTELPSLIVFSCDFSPPSLFPRERTEAGLYFIRALRPQDPMLGLRSPQSKQTIFVPTHSRLKGVFFGSILPERSHIMAEKSPHFKNILSQVRERLRTENVKLWLAPYTTANDEPGKYPEVNL